MIPSASITTLANELGSRIDLVSEGLNGVKSKIVVGSGYTQISAYAGSSSLASFYSDSISLLSPGSININASGRLNLYGGAQIFVTGTINGTCTNANYAESANYATTAGRISNTVWRYSTNLGNYYLSRY